MIKAIGLVKRKDGMSFEDFVDYYKIKHAKLGERVMRSVGAVRYERRFVTSMPQPATGEVPPSPFDAIVEFWFEDRAAMEATFAMSHGPMRDEFVLDEDAFLDRDASCLMFVVEEDLSTL